MDRNVVRFPLPDHLPPEAALALFDCLSDLLDAVWQHYEPVLLDQILHNQNAPPDLHVEPEFDDEIPF
ncbi:MAG: hypothetical protein L0Y58_06830 [Verrucomicrobia subdivision 3 bacterium]|nr:hypothetical protein [Limisphaerales bacterium]